MGPRLPETHKGYIAIYCQVPITSPPAMDGWYSRRPCDLPMLDDHHPLQTRKRSQLIESRTGLRMTRSARITTSVLAT
jgi:hypothetical protein